MTAVQVCPATDVQCSRDCVQICRLDVNSKTPPKRDHATVRRAALIQELRSRAGEGALLHTQDWKEIAQALLRAADEIEGLAWNYQYRVEQLDHIRRIVGDKSER